MEVLVDSFTNYQLYYRDPDSRSFVPVKISRQGKEYKYSIVFRVFREDISPERIDLTYTRPVDKFQRYGRKENRTELIRQIRL